MYLRVTPTLRTQIEKQARVENRNLADMMRVLMLRGLEKATA